MISVVIPAYKKTVELVRNLKKNIKYLKDCELIVVNDNPEQSLKDSLKEFSLILIENKKNLGFAGAADTGIKHAKGETVFLLNSDVILLDDSFKKTVKRFEKNSLLFAVTFAQKEKDGSIVGKNTLFWKDGFLHHAKADNLDEGENGWAEGGSSLFNKDLYLKTGGFDQMFNPFYWEDIELSYRAKKRGYSVIFDPSVLVEHHHESTIGSFFNRTHINSIAYRNQLLCIWKHIGDTGLFTHVYFLGKMLLRSLFKGDSAFISGFAKALMMLPKVL